jgi:hypothetical protein
MEAVLQLPEGAITLNAEISLLLQNRLKHAVTGFVMDKQLLGLLVQNNIIIPGETTYAQVKANARLNGSLIFYLAQGLSQDPATGKWSMRISDWELYFRCKGQDIYTYLKSIGISDISEIEELKKKRDSIRKFVVRVKVNLV